DNDCDEATPDDDLDADGYDLAEDCDDADAGESPGLDEEPYDGLDNDCDGVTDGPEARCDVALGVHQAGWTCSADGCRVVCDPGWVTANYLAAGCERGWTPGPQLFNAGQGVDAALASGAADRQGAAVLALGGNSLRLVGPDVNLLLAQGAVGDSFERPTAVPFAGGWLVVTVRRARQQQIFGGTALVVHAMPSDAGEGGWSIARMPMVAVEDPEQIAATVAGDSAWIAVLGRPIAVQNGRYVGSTHITDAAMRAQHGQIVEGAQEELIWVPNIVWNSPQVMQVQSGALTAFTLEGRPYAWVTVAANAAILGGAELMGLDDMEPRGQITPRGMRQASVLVDGSRFHYAAVGLTNDNVNALFWGVATVGNEVDVVRRGPLDLGTSVPLAVDGVQTGAGVVWLVDEQDSAGQPGCYLGFVTAQNGAVTGHSRLAMLPGCQRLRAAVRDLRGGQAPKVFVFDGLWRLHGGDLR
ncbi:MAG: putative metal-binding motif-containing protein, partial [Myxococcales bacterium]|nr:putative metal-binding motif-containing protein [Myxococcales bacterium]